MINNKKIIIFLICLIVVFSIFKIGVYYERHKNNNDKSMNDLGISINEYVYKAIDKGDISAYNSLQITYLDYSAEDFLPIALGMANKQKYPPAYLNVYETLIDIENLNEESDSISKWKNWNPQMERFALEYLLIGAKLNNNQSIEIIKSYYLKGKKLNKILSRHKDLLFQYAQTLNEIEESKI